MPIENLTGRITWDDLRFPAQGINPAGAGGPPAVDTTEPYQGTLRFSDTAIDVIGGFAQMPHQWAEGSTISPHIHWMATTTAVGNVAWRFSYMIADVNGNFSGAMTVQAITLGATPGNITKHMVLEFPDISMAGYKISAGILWRVERRGTDGTDTYNDPARLLEFDIHYQIDSYGSRQEFIK